MITEQLDDDDKLQLMLVCFKLLNMVAESIFRRQKGQFYIDDAVVYVKARVSPFTCPLPPLTAKFLALVRRWSDPSSKILGYS